MRAQRTSRHAQALIEFIVGIVAVIALFAGLLQIASLSKAQTDALTGARREAAERAMDSAGLLGTAEYIEEVQVGDDGAAYSVDDETTPGDTSAFLATVVEPAAASAADWSLIDSVPDNRFTALRTASLPTYEFQMVSGTDSRSVSLIGAVKHLIYDADSIDIESEVWMPWLNGIY